MLLNELPCFWVGEREGAPEESQGYLFCNLEKRKKEKKRHISKLLLEIFNDRIAIQNFFRGNVADYKQNMHFHFAEEERATWRGVMVFQGQQQPSQFHPPLKGQPCLPPSTWSVPTLSLEGCILMKVTHLWEKEKEVKGLYLLKPPTVLDQGWEQSRQHWSLEVT